MMNFQFMNAYEVLVNNRKFLYKGSRLFHVLDREETPVWRFRDWCGAPVENETMVRLFREFRRHYGKNLKGLYGKEIHFEGLRTIDRWEEVILSAVKQFPQGFRFRDLYYAIAMQLCADSEEDARNGWAYHPYTGKRIHVERCFGTWITERSPDSRNRYVKGGKLTRWTHETKPLLFVNPGLRAANQACKWMPFNSEGKRNPVRGDLWFWDPAAAQQVEAPAMDVLETAESMYRVKGMQGGRGKGAETYAMMGIRV